jgi:hypothetical protein
MIAGNVALSALVGILAVLAIAQAEPKQQPPTKAAKQVQTPAAKPVNRHLVRVETITTSSETVGLFRLPLRCDGDGNLYLHTDSAGASAIHKLNAKGEKLALFEASPNPNFPKIDVASHFDLEGDGSEVHEIVFPHEISRYVFVFSSDGTLKSTVKLQPGFPFMPGKLAVFPTGQYLISGLKYDADRTAAMWPFNGIFAADGRLLKEIELRDDKTLHDMAASGDARAALPGNPHANRAISNSQVEVADDGNAYLMRWTNPAIFYAISPGGEVVRRFTVDPGDSGYRPAAMHVYKGRIAVLFVEAQSGDEVMRIVDLQGHEIATYDDPKPDDPKATNNSRLGAAFACYTENPTRFVFLGASDDNRLQFLIAEPR